jgi:hypothetical protein
VEENIDKSEQMSLKQVEAFLAKRIERGEVDYNGKSVIVKQPDNTKKDPLIVCGERGILEDWHVSTGQQLRSIREIGQGRLLQGRRASDVSGSNGEMCYQTLFNRIKNRLTRNDWKRISMLCFATPDIDGRYGFSESDYKLLYAMTPSYQYAFEELDKIITSELESIKNAIDNAVDKK